MRDFDEFVKIAKTRLKKEIEAGRINKRLAQKFYFQVPKVEDNLNNRINARAKRAAEAAMLRTKRDSADIKHTIRDAKGALKQLGEQPKTQNVIERIKEKAIALKNGQKTLDKTMREAKSRASLSDIGKGKMTLDKYLRASKVDNLRARPMVDSSRGAMKREGKRFAILKNYGDRNLPYGVKITHSDSPKILDGSSSKIIDKNSGRHIGENIELCNKDARYYLDVLTGKFKRLSKKESKEHRSVITRHEGLGEFPGHVRSDIAMNTANLAPKYKTDPAYYRFGHIGSHASPFVLIGDHLYAKKLSPITAERNFRLRKDLGENSQMNYALLGSKATDKQLKMPFHKNFPSNGKFDAEQIFMNNAERQGYDTSAPGVKAFAKIMGSQYSGFKR